MCWVLKCRKGNVFTFSIRNNSITKTTLIILCIDLLATIINLPIALATRVVTDVHGNLMCKETWGWKWELYYGKITWFVIQIIIPFPIIAICYTRIVIWLHLRKKDKRNTKSLTRQQSQEESARTLRMNKMLISMVVIFGVCWFPYPIINLVNLNIVGLDTGCWKLYYLSLSIAYVIAMSSTCYNPFLYCWHNTAFRGEFSKLLKCFQNTVGNHPVDERIKMEDMSPVMVTTTLQERVETEQNTEVMSVVVD